MTRPARLMLIAACLTATGPPAFGQDAYQGCIGDGRRRRSVEPEPA